MRLVFDIEGNGLFYEIDKIWCICAKDINTSKKYTWAVNSKETLYEFLNRVLSEADELIGHNIINFDLPVLKNLTGWKPNENTKISDTLVMSYLANPDRAKPSNPSCKGGPHSLEAWGYRVGKGKPDHKDWSVFSSAMLRRCREDVEINELVYHTVSTELDDFSEESVKLEHEIARIISEQEHRGIRFNYPQAIKFVEELTVKIDQIDKEVVPLLPKEIEVNSVPVLHPFKKNGEYRKQTLDYLREAYGAVYSERERAKLVGGPYSRIKFCEFNIGSTAKIKNYLLEQGWKPEYWNYSKTTGERTSPKLDGKFNGIDGVIPGKIKERITFRHRRSQIEGWINSSEVESEGVNILHPGAFTCGTNTGRFRHIGIVNIPQANSDKSTGELIWDIDKQKTVYGTQMRSLFIPRDGYKIVGHDASGLELRMLAHYMDDPEFTYQVLHGDIHTYNQEKAGLPTRNDAKTFIYALIYGAGDAKIGGIVGGDAEAGKLIKEEYFRGLPKLKTFIEKVKKASGKGWLRGLDGRRIYMRRDDSGRIARSKAVNTLLQSAGAVVMKKSCEILWESVKEAQIDAYKVLDMHDEGQSEVLDDEKVIELYSRLAVDSVVKAGEYFNLNIPLAAEVKVGINMAETH